MRNIRCVISNMPQRLLADIVESMIEESGNIEIVDRTNNVSEIHGVMARGPVDFLLMGMKGSDFPESCLDIMNEVPNLAIIGLVHDGRRLAAFLDNVGKNDVLKVIQALCPASEATGP